ncbi:MAG TPA: Ig-like domain-containing protein [Candidatus Baltobacteraceae bacterium]|jgi:hypothetical protein|nr:Ig-like domain-containing protein [Candidatus Baltobacteraceae bacterium]
MKTRFIALLLSTLALTACGGGGLTKLLGVPSIPTPSPAPSMQVTPASVTIAVGANATITASENSSYPSFSAQSTDDTIATVTQGNSQNAFVVTAVKAGKCSILIADAYGSSVTVPVTVH